MTSKVWVFRLALMLWFLEVLQLFGKCQGTSESFNTTELEKATKIIKKMLKKYDKYARPLVNQKPTQVYISMAIQAFSQIKESNMDFEVFMYLRQEWNDPRLAHQNLARLALTKERVNEIWTPDTYFNNANEYEVYTVNKLVLISGRGDIYYSGRVKVKGSCKMNLVSFPLDVQKCSLVLESFAYTVGQLNLKWKKKNPVLLFSRDLAEFDVVKYEIMEHNTTYVPGVYKNLVVTFTFHRRMGFYFIQFYIPCIVMVTLSWISFWMDRYYIGERVSLGITTVLTIVFLLGSSNSTMPRVSYAKAIDWYLIGSFMFVFSTLVTDLLIYRFSGGADSKRLGKENKDRKHISFQCQHGFKPAYVAESNGNIHIVSYDEEKASQYINTVKNCCLLPLNCHSPIKREDVDISIVINKCCRLMYPLAFILFNIVYWVNLFLSDW